MLQACIPHALDVQGGLKDRPADILLIGWSKGRDVCVDLTVTHPLGLDAHPVSLERAKKHLAAAESAKQTKEAASCALMGWGHHPAAYSPWGGEGPAARALLFEVTKRATADLQGWPRTQRMLEIRQGLSLALARGVAAQLALRCRLEEACIT